MPLHGKNFIAGRLEPGTDGSFNAVNPAGSTPLDPEFGKASVELVGQAAEAAAAAFDPYRKLPGPKRAEFLEAIAENIVALGDELLERANQETGLPAPRLIGERGRTVNQLRLFAQVVREGSWVEASIDTAQPDREPIPKPDLRRMLIPIGPVVVFGSSNFPLAFSVAGGDTASALATGNPVIVKAHSAHPGTSELVAGAIAKAVQDRGLPGGVFSLLHGQGSVIGTALVKQPPVRAVGFTGSREAGRALFDIAAARPDPIPVFAEMASLNPVFLLPGALKERTAPIAEGLKNSVTLGVGQFCTKPGLVFAVEGQALKELTGALVGQFESTAPATMLHAGICQAYKAGLAAATALDGVEVIGKSGQPVDPAQTHGEPVIAKTTAANFMAQPGLAEEVFGPFALVVTGQSLEELIAAAGSLEGQLTATVHGTQADFRQAGDLVAVLEKKAGRLIFNGYPTGVEVCPSMQHGGPYPATTDSRFTSVGTAALKRFVRPVAYQAFPPDLLPLELQDGNPLRIWRLVNGETTQEPI